MNSINKTARIVGALFIAELVVYMMGSTLTEGLLNTQGYLIKLAENKTRTL